VQDLVKDVEVALYTRLVNQPRLFQQVVHDGGRVNGSSWTKIYLDELSKATRVVVLKSLCVTKSLKKGVGVKYLALDCRLCAASTFGRFRCLSVKKVFNWAIKPSTSFSQIREHNFSGLRFPGPTLASDDDALILAVELEILVRIFCDHKKMRIRSGKTASACCTAFDSPLSVFLRLRGGEYIQSLERVYCHQNRRSNRGVDLLASMPQSNRVKQGSFVELTKLEQVVDTICTC
jgi:hypothetical protein